jgi:tetratricopeptide (TPR) repeat protein
MNPIRLMTFLSVVLFSITITANAQTAETRLSTGNSPKLQSGNEEISKVIAHIAELFKNRGAVIWGPAYDANNRLLYWGSQRNILVLEDRIEFRRKGENIIVYFSDIIDYKIDSYIDNEKNVCVIFGNFCILLVGKGNGKKLFDDLIFIQNQYQNRLIEKQKSQLILFEPIAAQYRALKVKPPVSEEQRKYIVQANSFNQQKMYDKAMELYNKAIELDQTAYPAAYSNLALLSAQLHKFSTAIYYMKKYLLLEPEAEDSRGAQDKIYEWEIMTQK